MMSKFASLYPQIRVAVYGLIAAGLAAAGIFGVVTEDQTAQALTAVTSILGTLGLLLAASNVKTSAPTVDAPAIADAVTARINGTVDTIAATVETSVADFRAQAEKALGDALNSATGKHRVQ